MKNISFLALITTSVVFLAGCATKQSPIAYDSRAHSPSSMKLAVLQGLVPEPSVGFPGIGDLLGYGLAMAGNADLRKRVGGYSTSEVQDYPKELESRLGKKGYRVSVVRTDVDFKKLPKRGSQRDGFESLDYRAVNLGDATHALVIKISHLGMSRKYASYVPIEPPKAALHATVTLSKLDNGAILWHEDMELAYAAAGEWDQPPDYPGLTNSYYRLVEEFKDKISETFK